MVKNIMLCLAVVLSCTGFVFASDNEFERSSESQRVAQHVQLKLELSDLNDFNHAFRAIDYSVPENLSELHTLAASGDLLSQLVLAHKIAKGIFKKELINGWNVSEWKELYDRSFIDPILALAFMCTYDYQALDHGRIEKLLGHALSKAKEGDPGFQFLLGTIDISGADDEEQNKRSFAWLKAASSQKHPLALNQIARYYSYGLACQKNPEEAINCHLLAADLEEADSQFKLACFYVTGTIVQKNEDSAILWFRKAISRGYVRAVEGLGAAYGEYFVVNKSDEKALEMYNIGAELHHAGCINNLGVMYEYGRGTNTNLEKARSCYEDSANLGDREGAKNIALVFYEAKGVPQDFRLARKWFKKAAALGHPDAMRNLSNMYDAGEGKPINKQKAIEWRKRAAENGDLVSCFNLGNHYLTGRDIEQDYYKAYHWYSIAARGGDKDAAKNMRLLVQNGLVLLK